LALRVDLVNLFRIPREGNFESLGNAGTAFEIGLEHIGFGPSVIQFFQKGYDFSVHFCL